MKSPTDRHIVLASNSPRRRALLKEIVPDFEIAPSRQVDESYPDDLNVFEVAPYLSRKKAEAYGDLTGEDTVVVTADTVVIIDGRILGKPRDAHDACRMLRQLSGREHVVVTGVTVKSKDKTETFSCRTSVFFDNISDDEISDYVAEFNPLDKAGSYGIQEWIGCRGIKKIEGCFYNVMGLPLNMLYDKLKTLF